MATYYHWKNIQTLLNDAFTDQALRCFCYDTPAFRAVYRALTRDTSKANVVDRIIRQAEREAQIETLLEAAKAHAPAKYQAHGPYYSDTPVSIDEAVEGTDEASETAPPAEPPEPERNGGVTFHGRTTVEGDVVGRDKIEQISGDKIHGDKIEGHISHVGPGAQVAVGKQITQTISSGSSQLSGAELAEIKRLLAELDHQLAQLEISERDKLIAQEFTQQLATELTRTDEQPDASTIKVAGHWLLDKVPDLRDPLARLFLHPATIKVVDIAGGIATAWVQTQFGSGP